MNRLISGFLFVAIAASAHPMVLWDESIDGDLSGDRLAPTNLVLSPGTHSVIATSVSGDREYVHFSLGAGQSLVELNLVAWSGLDGIGFIAVQEGSTFTEPHLMTNVANLLGYTHMGPDAGNLNADLLPIMGMGAGAIGFTPPLTGTDYTFWYQQTGQNASTYQLDYVVVPEPAGLVAAAAAAIALRRRRK